MKQLSSILPTQSLIYFLICAAGVLVFLFLIIIPTQKASTDLVKDIEKLNSHIEEQRILKPVFDSLLKRAKDKNETGLPLTPKAKLARADIGNLSEQLQEIARRHNLKLEDIKTDVNTLTNKTGYLLVNLSAAGDFMQFRDFLIDLGTIPSLEYIEDINIRAIEASREISLKLWLAQK